MQQGPGGRALVLCYHAVSPTWPAPLSVTPEHFRAQIARLLRRGYRPVTFADAVAAGRGQKLVAITFDDGYRSVLEHAAPILAKLGVPATLFVPTAHVGSDRPMSWAGIDRWVGTEHEAELSPLGWDDLGRLSDSGWEIGSHTRTHPHLSRVGPEALHEELTESRRACEEHIGRRCRSVAYPYGDVDERVLAATADAGYEYGAALTVSTPAPQPLHWPRIGIYRDEPTWRFELKVAAPVQRLLGSPVGPLVAAGLARRAARRRRETLGHASGTA